MVEKHFLVSDLEKAEQDSTKDFYLSMSAKHTYTEFFKDENNEIHWKERLATIKDVDLKRSPLFEAIWFFGQWKIEKDYKIGTKSAEKFREMERLAYEKDWVWILTYCLETVVYIYRVLGYRNELKLLCKSISSYFHERKEMFPTHTILELARLFNSIIINADRADLDEVFKILIEFSERRIGKDPYHFQRSFLFEAIEIARFLKSEADVKELQDKVIQSWVEEADLKGKASNLVKVALLQQALDYCASVGNKEQIQQLKKELSTIDFSDELKEITLPKQKKEEFERAVKGYYEKMRGVVRKYVNGLSKLDPLKILLNICYDESIIRINLKETRNFVQKLMKEHPIRHIFGTILDTGEKTIRLESAKEKQKFELNKQLMFGVNETIWIVDQIFRELSERNLVTVSSVGNFLAHCSSVSKNSYKIIGFGLCHHFQQDYVASVSILTPLVESILFDYLASVGADVSSYEGKVIEQRELGGLLNLDEVKDKLGEDFQQFLKLLLVEPDSINFRNRFAHGNLGVAEYNRVVSSVILFIILKICSKTYSFK